MWSWLFPIWLPPFHFPLQHSSLLYKNVDNGWNLYSFFFFPILAGSKRKEFSCCCRMWSSNVNSVAPTRSWKNKTSRQIVFNTVRLIAPNRATFFILLVVFSAPTIIDWLIGECRGGHGIVSFFSFVGERWWRMPDEIPLRAPGRKMVSAVLSRLAGNIEEHA